MQNVELLNVKADGTHGYTRALRNQYKNTKDYRTCKQSNVQKNARTIPLPFRSLSCPPCKADSRVGTNLHGWIKKGT